MTTIPTNQSGPQIVTLLTEILTVLRRLERIQDEYAEAYLNARYPYGKPTDRWKRSA